MLTCKKCASQGNKHQSFLSSYICLYVTIYLPLCLSDPISLSLCPYSLSIWHYLSDPSSVYLIQSLCLYVPVSVYLTLPLCPFLRLSNTISLAISLPIWHYLCPSDTISLALALSIWPSLCLFVPISVYLALSLCLSDTISLSLSLSIYLGTSVWGWASWTPRSRACRLHPGHTGSTSAQSAV